MKEFLSQKNVSFIERDVSADEQALNELSALGLFATPVTIINGVSVIGFDRSRLEALLAEAPLR